LFEIQNTDDPQKGYFETKLYKGISPLMPEQEEQVVYPAMQQLLRQHSRGSTTEQAEQTDYLTKSIYHFF